MKTSEAINEICDALSKAQGQFKAAKKESINPHFKSKYADLASVWDAVREPLAVNGLTVLQDVTTGEKSVSISTRVAHKSGQWIEFGPLSVPLSKNDAHGVGSAISYSKRYSLSSALGIASDEDDDGNHAVAASHSRTAEVAQRIQRPAFEPRDEPPPPDEYHGPPEDVARGDFESPQKPKRRPSGVIAWFDDRDGRFLKGQPIEEISPAGLGVMIRMLRTPGDKKYAESNAKKLEAIESELSARSMQ